MKRKEFSREFKLEATDCWKKAGSRQLTWPESWGLGEISYINGKKR
jgi:hypothetical protein